MATNTYEIDNPVICRASWTVDGTATDPTTVTFKVRHPVTRATTPYVFGEASDVTKVADGVFELRLAPDAVGDWRWRAIGTGAAKAAQTRMFKVRGTSVP